MRKTFFRLAHGAMLFALCLPAGAQQTGKVARVGYLSPRSALEPLDEAFRQGLRELGYVEGKNVIVEYQFAEEKIDRLPALAAELVRLNVDVLVARASPGALAAKNATKAIPIVFTSVGDPVGQGLVASLARPGGNITGLATLSPELSGKRLELLKEAVPTLSRVAIFWNPTNPNNSLQLKEVQTAAQTLSLRMQPLEVSKSDDFERAFSAMARERAGALLVLQDNLLSSRGSRIADFVTKNRLPAIHGEASFAEAGGLMTYGPSYPDMFRRAATYVDKILKGAKPADLPVEQPTKFEFIINLKAAKQIGLTIPPNVLVRADKVIR